MDATPTAASEQRFIANMRAERDRQELTQDGLARLTGLAVPAIASLETGRRRLRFGEALVIAEALGRSAEQMLNEPPESEAVA